MHFSSLFALGFVATAIAAPAVSIASGADDIVGALNSVKTAVNDLNGTVQKVQKPEDKAAFEAVSEKSEHLNTVIAAAKVKVEKTSAPGLLDALSISQPATELAGSVGELSTNLGAKKAIMDKAGQTKIVASKLAQSKENSKGLSNAVTAKLPSVAKPFAEKASSKIDSSLEKVISTFNSK